MSDPLSDVFRANVLAALRAQRITQTELARRVGTTSDNVGKTLRNPRGVGVTLATVDRYAHALGIEASVLVTPGGVQRMRTVRLIRADDRQTTSIDMRTG